MKQKDWLYIESDYYRWTRISRNNGGGKFFHLKIIIFALFGRIPGFTYCFWFRMANAKGIMGIIGRWKHYKNRIKYGTEIIWSTQIGYGLFLPHPFSITINSSTIIGNNCCINKGVNIGSKNCKAAIIGNNVYIGPNVCIIENVRIGNNVTIGAGSIVVKDIPENATVAGNPAKIISYKDHSDLRLKVWKNNI